jgi:tryptophanyl-tRNA synthetase
LKKGCDVARAEAAETLNMVRRAMKINYFEDTELIRQQSEMYKAAK